MAKLARVLSIDGGGIRGIIPATILAAIETATKQATSKSFDLIAGTSTGGITALGLTKPGRNGEPEYTAKTLLDMYEMEGKTIFPRPRFGMVKSLFTSRYPSYGIESVLSRYFGEAKFSDALTNVLVPAYDIEQRYPTFFKSYKFDAKQWTMKQVARATSAAPTYFKPAQIIDSEGEVKALIDGGVFANNPAVCAYVDALEMFPDKEIVMVSIGTGSLTRRFPYEEAKNWGLLRWAKPTLDIVFDGVNESTDFQMS